MSTVFLALQTNEDTRPIIEAILQDNPGAVVDEQPAMVKINADGRLVVRRETIEELIGRDYDLQELQVNMITMSGNLDQTDDEITLFWKS
ncbi:MULTISPECIES: MmoB/DmpM family protein [Thauera]|jgi:phenol hydroxylase P2 protein|uniref:Monooxygenase component MmoB/DmpM n=2 Tax=Thauera aminoaromatica TaxID=164330 RepID=N6Z2K6_THASP|nr:MULTISPECIES: MmoB/DmpM family protein [Thauera]ACR01711.1 monooxygenase component MmoB/DmpM [Thauera aminoaromatica]ENO88832.1 monooxygenase component MmoB/DmpM [Thauera aminoaromatica S2]KIN88987.1 phenol hydroxylase P2 protein [Thauera sp. SWB20]MBP6131179.1 MmoB/DmpM family protein [Thauera sp.]MBP7046777.1 MmoB/DmpM family protein [Thauera sp.]